MKKMNIVAIMACILAVTACRKEKKAELVRNNLVGTWKATENAVDNNNNGTLDAGEAYPDKIYTVHKLVFDDAGTLTFMNNTILTGKRSWELLNDNTYLRLFDPGASTSYHIDAISSSSLTLKDTAGGKTTWVVFAKQ